MTQTPTLIFVPGAWHTAETWSQTIAELEPKGFKCIAVTLPSTTSVTAGLGDDVEAVQDAIRAESDEGRDVVLIVHSYGGLVGSSSIRGFAKKAHDDSVKSLVKDESSSGRVIGLALIATGFVKTGLSFLGATGGKPPPQWVADTEAGTARLIVDPRDWFYHDLPEEEGKAWVEKLTPHSLKSLAEGGEHAYAGWKDVPCWFLVTLEDRALPGAFQEMLVQGAVAEGGDVTMRKIETSHSPMLSQPQKTAEFISDAVASFTQPS